MSEPALLEAIQHRSSANLVHFDTAYKVDLMISRERPFEKSRFQRRVQLPAGSHYFWVASAEDTVLVKLECYRLGQEVSDRQWRDILTVLLTAPTDPKYLEHWASELGVLDLLEKARHVLANPGPG